MVIELDDGTCFDAEQIALISPIQTFESYQFYMVRLKCNYDLMIHADKVKSPSYDRDKLIKEWKFSQVSV